MAEFNEMKSDSMESILEEVKKMVLTLKRYNGNKTEELLKKKSAILCECGTTTDYNHTTRHKASKRHQKLLNKINGIEEPPKVKKTRVKKEVETEVV